MNTATKVVKEGEKFSPGGATSSAVATKPKAMGLLTAIALVSGSMIGSGIFIVPADIARLVNSPLSLLLVWLVTAWLTVSIALSYGELAALMPHSGGQYVYLRESLGKLCAFLYGWTLFLVIQTGSIAAVAVAFAKFLGFWWPQIAHDHWLVYLGHVPTVKWGPMVLGNIHVGLNTQNLVAILVILLLTTINMLGVKFGALLQNIFTFAKVLGLLVVLGASLGFGQQEVWTLLKNAATHDLFAGAGSLWGNLEHILVLVSIAQVGALFSADAWNNVTFIAGELKNPARNLPRALLVGTLGVVLLYLLINVGYLKVLPFSGEASGLTPLTRGIQYALEDRVGTAVMEQLWGPLGASFITLLILLSTFGCANGLILAGSRVFQTIAQDHRLFKLMGSIHPRTHTPVRALGVQASWCILLCLSGSFAQLLDYVIFAVLLFYILTIIGLFVLRYRQPTAPRPYRVWLYPYLPLGYLVGASFIEILLLYYKPNYTWPGLLLVFLGVPVYFLKFGLRHARSD